jgi:hypothetical protein
LILYVNGDSHSAGAEAVNNYCFAIDDIKKYYRLGRAPHPDNLKVSYGQLVADNLDYQLVCDAESGASNTRILRTTYSYLEKTTPDLIIIGWATWEREEWMFDDKYYQFSAGLDPAHLPKEIAEVFKKWVIDRWQPHIYCKYWQDQIWQLHQDLMLKQIPHLFFNSYCNLIIPKSEELNWGDSYLDPYSQQGTYWDWVSELGYQTVNPKSFHFGADAHQAWANHLTKIIKESIMVK